MKNLALLLICVALFSSCNDDKKLNDYGYVFHESTGPNQYIIMEGRQVPIKGLVSDASDQLALKSLQALKWNVLYPNGDGDKIFVRGEYDPQSQSFRLTHWYIKTPFESLAIEDETDVPHNVHKVTRDSLERTDFEIKNGFDPKDPGFDPKTYQRRQ